MKPLPSQHQTQTATHTQTITCTACNGNGTKESLFYSTKLTTNCQNCKGTGQLIICSSCGGKLNYSRYGSSCGCNALALKVAA